MLSVIRLATEEQMERRLVGAVRGDTDLVRMVGVVHFRCEVDYVRVVRLRVLLRIQMMSRVVEN